MTSPQPTEFGRRPLCQHIADATGAAAGVELLPIMQLHRHNDGYIAFALRRWDESKQQRTLAPRIAIRSDELETWFPQFREELTVDSLVSINASWRIAYKTRNRDPYGLPRHDTSNLRYLCGCYSDIDYYRLGLDFNTTFRTVLDYQDKGYLPRASVIVKSGRGMWLLWFLYDPKNPNQAQPAFEEKIHLYLRINTELTQRIASIGADAGARDAARWVSVPGSIHSGTGERIRWWIQGEGNSGYRYTLADLAQFLQIEPRKFHPKIKRAIAEGEQPKNQRRRGWERLNALRLKEFELLRSSRGGFEEGKPSRYMAALLYAWLLRCNGISRSDAAKEVAQFGAECRPPLPSAEVRSAIRGGFGRTMGKMKDQSIADWLEITPDEAEVIGGRLPPASRFITIEQRLKARELEAAKTPRTTGTEERRALVHQIITTERNGLVPPCREMQKIVKERGFEVSHVQVHFDYKALGLSSDRSMAARNAAREKQKPLPFNDYRHC